MWVTLGTVFVILGMIGAVVPLLPTTVFLIAAAGCFARSSPALEHRLISHPMLGPSVKAWREHGAIPRRGKTLACIGMASGFAIFLATARPGMPLTILVAAALSLGAIFVCTRPST